MSSTQELVSNAEAAKGERIISEDVVDKVLGAWNARLAEELAEGPAEPTPLGVDELALG